MAKERHYIPTAEAVGKGEKYIPYTEEEWKEFYPCHLSEERKKQLDEWKYTARDLTAEDMVYTISKGAQGLYEFLVKAMRRVVGDEATKNILIENGRIRGEYNLRRAMKALGTDDPSPEQWSWYQDLGHCSAGYEYSQAYGEYDDKQCIIRRKHCNWYSQDPEVKEFCRYQDQIGYMEAYSKTQPTIEATLAKCMPDGDEYCMHVFRRKE